MQVFLVLNGQSAGPFDEAQARAMLAAGQAGPDTLCCPVGEQAWRPLGSVLAPAPGAMPAMPLGPYGGGAPFPAAVPNNGLAITSLVLGCSSLLCCVTGIPAVICGHLALGQIKRANGTQAGRGMAIAGLVIGYVFTAFMALYFLALFAGIALPAFSSARGASRENQCLADARQLFTACQVYAADNDGKFPPRLEDLYPTYLTDEKLLLCPLKETGKGNGYEYFGGKETDSPNRVLLRSRDQTPQGWRIVALVDGTVEKLRKPVDEPQ